MFPETCRYISQRDERQSKQWLLCIGCKARDYSPCGLVKLPTFGEAVEVQEPELDCVDKGPTKAEAHVNSRKQPQINISGHAIECSCIIIQYVG